jgi:hypothetical protein
MLCRSSWEDYLRSLSSKKLTTPIVHDRWWLWYYMSCIVISLFAHQSWEQLYRAMRTAQHLFSITKPIIYLTTPRCKLGWRSRWRYSVFGCGMFTGQLLARNLHSRLRWWNNGRGNCDFSPRRRTISEYRVLSTLQSSHNRNRAMLEMFFRVGLEIPRYALFRGKHLAASEVVTIYRNLIRADLGTWKYGRSWGSSITPIENNLNRSERSFIILQLKKDFSKRTRATLGTFWRVEELERQ